MKFNVEKALQVCGNNNTYQKLMFIAVALSWFSVDFIAISFPLLELLPKFSCKGPNGEWKSCEEKEICKMSPDDYKANVIYTNLVTDLGLYCQTIKVMAVGVTYAVGVLIGALLASKFSDVLGRKPVLLICQILFAFAALILTLVSNIYLVFILLFFIGISSAGGVMVSFLYIQEVLAPNKRSLYGTLVNSSFAIAGIIYFTAFKYLKNWKYIAYLCTVTDIIAALMILFYFTESPRYLLSKGQFEKALKSLHRISIKNGKSQDFYKFLVSDVSVEKHYDDPVSIHSNNTTNNENNSNNNSADVNMFFDNNNNELNSSNKSTITQTPLNGKILEKMIKRIRNGSTESTDDENKEEPLIQSEIEKKKVKVASSNETVSETYNNEQGFLALVKYKSVRKNFLICSYLWFAMSFTYYGISLDLKNSDNIFRDGYVVYGAEGISYMVTGIIISIAFFGRVRTITIMMLLTFFSTAIYFFLDKFKLLPYNTIVLFLARFSITSIYSVMYTYSTEVYPTTVRSKGLGINTLFARFSTILVPIIVQIVNPFLIFSSLCLIGFILSFFIPETFGKELEDEILEERLCKKNILEH